MFLIQWRSKNDVISLMLWLYGLSRICGNWPFSIEFKRKRELSRVRVTFVDWLWFVVAFAYYGSIVWFGIINNFSAVVLSSFELFLSQAMQLSSMAIVTLSLILDMINRNTLWNIVVQFYVFDEEVSEQ